MLIYLYWFPCLIFLWVIGYNFKFWLTESPVNFRNILNSLLPFCNPLELISITFWLNQAHSLWLILYFNVRKSEPVYTGFSSDAIWVSKKTNFGINMKNSMCYRSKSFCCVGISLKMNIRGGSGVTIYYRVLYPEPNRKSVKTWYWNSYYEVMNIWKIIYVNCWVENYMKEDHRSCIRNFCSC